MGDARDATFAFVSVFVLPSPVEKSRSLAQEEKFSLRANMRNLASFLRLGANDARAIFEEICVLGIFVRANASSCAREER